MSPHIGLRPLLLLLLLAIATSAHLDASGQEKPTMPTMPFEMAKPGLDVGVVVSDMQKAKKFYGDALGLRPLPALPIELPGGGTMVRYQAGYTVIKLRTFPTAPPAVEKGTMSANGIRLLTIYIRNAEALASHFTELGFTAPKFSPAGTEARGLAFVNDPDGNRIELLDYGERQSEFDRVQIGLTVSNAEKAREFYGKVLGLKERPGVLLPANFAADTMEYFFEAGATTIKFWAPKTERPTRTGPIGAALGIRYFTFMVKDVDATYEALKARGVKVTVPPVDLGTIARIMLISDPDGNTIEFAAPRASR